VKQEKYFWIIIVRRIRLFRSEPGCRSTSAKLWACGFGRWQTGVLGGFIDRSGAFDRKRRGVDAVADLRDAKTICTFKTA
jgi:hypothetical protein